MSIVHKTELLTGLSSMHMRNEECSKVMLVKGEPRFRLYVQGDFKHVRSAGWVGIGILVKQRQLCL